MKSVDLQKLVSFLDSYCDIAAFQDAPAARNGLQFENSGNVTKIAVAVDAGIAEFELAAHIGANLLIVHHGMFWGESAPFVGASYQKIKTLIDSDIAVYSVHLPLDAHPQVGNNVLIAGALGLKQTGRCFELGGAEVGVLAAPPEGGLAELQKRLKRLFPKTYKEIICGTSKPKKIAICSGSCGDVLPLMPQLGIDTLVCGELRQRHFTLAQELGLNLFPCGHYATECFGVIALGEVLAKKFKLESKFIEMPNPL